jgi:hypothetical protein
VRKWRYGFFDIRARLPCGRCLWPTLWPRQCPPHNYVWPEVGVVDTMEYVGLILRLFMPPFTPGRTMTISAHALQPEKWLRQPARSLPIISSASPLIASASELAAGTILCLRMTRLATTAPGPLTMSWSSSSMLLLVVTGLASRALTVWLYHGRWR